MKAIILVPSGSKPRVDPLIATLVGQLDALVVELDEDKGVVVKAANGSTVPPVPPQTVKDSRWPIDDRWFELLARYAAQRAILAPTPEEFGAYRDLTHSLGEHGLEDPDVILAIDGAIIHAALGAFAPFVAVVNELPPSIGDGPLPGPWVFALHAAPIIVATTLESLFGLTNRNYPSVYFCPLSADPGAEPVAAEAPGTEAALAEAAPLQEATYTILISRQLPEPLHSDFSPVTSPFEPGDAPPEAPTRGAAQVLRVAAALAAQAAPGHSLRVLLPGDAFEPLQRLAEQLGLGPSLEWLGGDPPGAEVFRRADVVLVPSSDPYEMEEDVTRAAALGKPSALMDGLQFLNSIHLTPIPGIAIANPESIDCAALDAAAAAAREWFDRERSLAAVASRLESLAHTVAIGVSPSAPIYSFQQKREELIYEKEVAAQYDEKYHAGICYQQIDALLAKIIADNAPSDGQPLRILDLGCGPGSLVPHLRQIPNAEITGVDLSPEMIAVARSRYPGVEFREGDCEAIPSEAEQFDAVLCSGVLHHLPTLAPTLAEIHRVLRPDGILVAREPNDDHFGSRQPKEAFVHLCLRHHLYLALVEACSHCGGKTRPRVVEEPAPHRFHREFTAPHLVDALASKFRVEILGTELRVGYFYDMISDYDLFEPVGRLEASLNDQPGLNLVAVARRGTDVGIAQNVTAKLAEFGETRPVSLEHLALTAEAIEWFGRRAPLDLPTDADLSARGWRSVLPGGGTRVLALSDEPSRLAALEAELDIEAKGDFLPLSEVPPTASAYDVVLVDVVAAAGAEDLLAAMSACRAYGRFYLELGAGAQLTGQTELPDLSVAALGSRDGALRCLAVPMGYTVQDARLALRPLLLAHPDRDEKIELVLKNLHRTLLRAELAGDFSTLRAAGVGRTMRRVLDAL